ncbi:MAG: molybdopterin-dependent oxidoreductase [Firmicutes bacterium]|nr:molybdopterin-dependent oxidoreductase [Bacillota bacterium]
MQETLSVGGLVKHPVTMWRAREVLGRISRVEDFVCLEGWMRPQQHWSGYRLEDLLNLAVPLAPYVEVASGTFVAVFAVSEVKGSNILLADTCNGQLLEAERGGPWRLVAPGRECFFSVKAVDRITVVATRSGETARRLALARIGRLDPDSAPSSSEEPTVG